MVDGPVTLGGFNQRTPRLRQITAHYGCEPSTTGGMGMADRAVDPIGPERELRLAIVCFGGVSLAIYMHGQTKEIHRLVRASVQGPAGNNASSQGVYADLLNQMQQDDAENVRTRVVVDIIAGTSAGGINGIYLAKALAHDLSQEGLRNLWFEHGDIKQLLRGPSWG
jgi:hypothetical protein